MSGPHKFNNANTNADMRASNALEFIAERMAGIEWLLSELNDKAFKIQTSLTSIAHVLPNKK